MHWDQGFWETLQKKVPILCVDGLVINEKREVLLTKRAIPPQIGYWHLPGGHINYMETCEAAVLRKVKEETGLKSKIVSLLGVYSDSKRDSRGHFVSVVYLLKPLSAEISKDFQASEIKYFSRLPDKVGFDHRQVVLDGLKLFDKLSE